MDSDKKSQKDIKATLKEYKSYVTRLDNALFLKKITKQEYDLKIYSKFGTLNYKEKIDKLSNALKTNSAASKKLIVPIIASIVLVFLISLTIYTGIKPNAYVVYNSTNTSSGHISSQINQPGSANNTAENLPVQNPTVNKNKKTTQEQNTTYQTNQPNKNTAGSKNQINNNKNNNNTKQTNTTVSGNTTINTSTDLTKNKTITTKTNETETLNSTQTKTNQTIKQTMNNTTNTTNINKTINSTINISENQTINNTINLTNKTNNTNINNTINSTINISENQTINKTINNTINNTENLTNKTINNTTNKTNINKTINSTINISKNQTINQTINNTINKTINNTINLTVNKTFAGKTTISIDNIKNAFTNTVISKDTKTSIPYEINLTKYSNESELISHQITITGDNLQQLLTSVSSIRIMYNSTLLALIHLNSTENKGTSQSSVITGFASSSQDNSGSSTTLIGQIFSSVYSFFANILGSMKNLITGNVVSNNPTSKNTEKTSYSLVYLNNETIPKIAIIPLDNELDINLTINNTKNQTKKNQYKLILDLKSPKINASITKGKTRDNLTVDITNPNNEEYSNIAFALQLTDILANESSIIKSLNATKLIMTTAQNTTKISYSISNQINPSENSIKNKKIMFIQLSNLTAEKTTRFIFSIPKSQISITRKILQNNSEEVTVSFANQTSEKNISLEIVSNETSYLKNISGMITFQCNENKLNTTTNITGSNLKMKYRTGTNTKACNKIIIELPELNSSFIESYIITANNISKEFSIGNSKTTISPKITTIITNCNNCKYKCITNPKNICISNNQSSNKWKFAGDLTYNLNMTQEKDKNYSAAYLCLNENYNQESRATPVTIELIGKSANCSENTSFVKDYTQIGSFIAYHPENYCIPLDIEKINNYLSENNATDINLRLKANLKNNIVCFENSKGKNLGIEQLLTDKNSTIYDPVIGLVR